MAVEQAAVVYADALYDAALEAGRQDETQFATARVAAVGRDLHDLVGALVDNEQLTRALFNPAVPTEAKDRVLRQVASEADPLVVGALTVMLENGRLGLLPDVQQAYTQRFDEANDQLDVQLTTAVAIDDDQAENLRSSLEQATGQTVQIRRVVDPSILGGVVLRVRDLLVDASVRRRLETLRRSLKNTRLPA